MSDRDKITRSSKRGDWKTPRWLFDKYNEIYEFTLDAAASAENALCENYFDKETDALKQDWKGSVWCNPPYGRDLWKWVKKAAESKATVVMLLPARTSTGWFHDYVLDNARIDFILGRLKFDDGDWPAPFSSIVCIWE